MSYKVLVVQTSKRGFERYKRLIDEAGFPEGLCFITSTPLMGRAMIGFGERQLLITGPFNGNEEVAKDFVRRAKERNDKLISANFTSLRTYYGQPHDLTVPEILENRPEGFIEYIRGFLARIARDPEW